MADVIFKTYAVEVKEANPETGEVDVFIPLSRDTVDRDGETVLPSAIAKRIQSFQKRPVLVSSHDYNGLTNQIGEFKSIKITDKGFYGKPQYYINRGNAEADWGFFLASIGMASYSIGFMPFESSGGGAKGGKVWTDVEILEVSHVIIPSNRDAAQSMRDALTAKGIKAPTALTMVIENVLTKPVAKEQKKPDHEARKTSQEELADNLEFTLSLVKTIGISEDIKTKALDLANEIRRLTGGDTPVHIKNPIRAMLEPVIKQMADHHDSHNKFHEEVMGCLKDMCDSEGDSEHPEMPDGDEDMTVARAIVQETVNQILRRK